MPDFELVSEPTSRLLYKGERAWLVERRSAEVNMPWTVASGSWVTWPHWCSQPTLQWKRKVLRDPDRVLPGFLWGAPPTFRVPYRSRAESQAAYETLLTLLDFYERLCNGAESANLLRLVQGLCFDDLDFQFRYSSLIRVVLSAIAGQEEGWNGPIAKLHFRKVLKASEAFRRAVKDAAFAISLAPSANFDDFVRGERPPIFQQDWQEILAEPLRGPDGEVIDFKESRPTCDDLLDRNEIRMRQTWSDFWGHTPTIYWMLEAFERDGALVEEQWASVERFNVFSDPKKQGLSYLISRTAKFLDRSFPSKPIADLVRVCDEIAQLTYGESAQEAAFKVLGRIREN
jgi:hypothetical protein